MTASAGEHRLIHLNAAGVDYLTYTAVSLRTSIRYFCVANRTMITKSHFLGIMVLAAALLVPASADERKPDECGFASIYGSTSEETASGEDTQPEDFTAAHRTLPFGTLVRVDDPKTGRWTVVRITDRGPFVSGRIIDVAQVAARQLGVSGLMQVCLRIVWIPGIQPAGGN